MHAREVGMDMIYLLGGRGFVGSGLARLFTRLGLPHRIIDRANYGTFTGSRCEILINAAGNSSKILARKDPAASYRANVTEVEGFLRDFEYGRFIHLSSGDVYEDLSSPTLTGEDSDQNPERLSPYGRHKLEAEALVRGLARRWLIFRPGGFVGPGLKKNAVFDILWGDRLWLDQESELQFLSTDAAAEMIWTLCAHGVENEIFNLGGAGVARLAEIMDWAGRRPPVEPGAPKIRYELALAKLARHLSPPETRGLVRAFVEQSREK